MLNLTLEKGISSVDDGYDPVLVENARRDPLAFGELYRRYVVRVYRYLISHVGEAEDAEDLTSQVFTAAFEGLSRYHERGNFAGWLFRIARHKVGDFYRRKRSHVSLEQAGETLRHDWDPILQLEQRENMRKLSDLVSQLDEDQRELLRLRFAADLSYAQIGEVLGRSEPAVKMAVHRLLRRLQSDWEQHDE